MPNKQKLENRLTREALDGFINHRLQNLISLTSKKDITDSVDIDIKTAFINIYIMYCFVWIVNTFVASACHEIFGMTGAVQTYFSTINIQK